MLEHPSPAVTNTRECPPVLLHGCSPGVLRLIPAVVVGEAHGSRPDQIRVHDVREDGEGLGIYHRHGALRVPPARNRGLSRRK
jgi:hypothetical protein